MLGKFMLGLVVVCALSMGIYTFTQRDTTPQNPQFTNQFMQMESGKRGDDPLYSEEIKKNTALTLQARDRADMLAQALDKLQHEKTLSDKKTQQALAKIDDLMAKLQVMNNQQPTAALSAEAQAQFDERFQTMTETIDSLSHSLQTTQQQSQAKIKALETALANQDMANEDTTNASDKVAQSFPIPLPAVASQALNATSDTPEKPMAKPSTITYAYGHHPADKPLTNANDNALLRSLTSTFDQAGGLITQGLDNTHQEMDKGNVPTFAQPQEKKEWATVFPVYTLPPNTVLAQSTLITPIIGRVPLGGRGKQQQVNDPFFFKVEIGKDNLAANGQKIPGVAKMIASGYATGVREQSCVRGYIDSLTFIFVDGRIVTQGGKSGSGTGNDEAMGYLADQWGKPCIRGKTISNAKDYLMSRGLASFVEAAATGLSQSQMHSDGSQQAVLSGDVWSYVLGAGIGGSASELADYVRDRTSDAFDVVYVEQARPVQIWLNDMIAIDYDSEARKVNYYDSPVSPIHYD